MKVTFATLLTLALATTGSVTAEMMELKSGSCYSKRFVADFEDQNFNPLLPTTNVMTSYKGLTYNGFVGENTRTLIVGGPENPLPGLVASSGKNFVVSSVVRDLLQGTSSVKPFGAFQTMNFHSFRFGCALNTVEGAVGVVTPCSITVKSYLSGHKKGEKKIEYKPTPTLKQKFEQLKKDIKDAKPNEVLKDVETILTYEMVKVDLPSEFCDVDLVEFTIDGFLEEKALVLGIDDLMYTGHTCGK
ncbi:hypothetical protein IE53DRAFT_360734 [Violaceomyces palustris]|uniref:Uncharacterized protein n=1 Tax=Violaceomyces palustris TaxID=1673888 RepID=A0ACD0P2Y9_9BASI|nr:hypothetical protein IE53DRAFT_360734 [Violaceomyces palustris]